MVINREMIPEPEIESTILTTNETCTGLIRPTDFSHLWVVCDFCDGMTYHKIAKEKMYICEYCDSYINMKSSERIAFLFDSDTWEPMDQQMRSLDPIHFDSLDPLHFDSLDNFEYPIKEPLDFDSLENFEDSNPEDSNSGEPAYSDSYSEDSNPEDSDSEESAGSDSDSEDSNPEDSEFEESAGSEASTEYCLDLDSLWYSEGLKEFLYDISAEFCTDWDRILEALSKLSLGRRWDILKELLYAVIQASPGFFSVQWDILTKGLAAFSSEDQSDILTKAFSAGIKASPDCCFDLYSFRESLLASLSDSLWESLLTRLSDSLLTRLSDSLSDSERLKLKKGLSAISPKEPPNIFVEAIYAAIDSINEPDYFDSVDNFEDSVDNFEDSDPEDPNIEPRPYIEPAFRERVDYIVLKASPDRRWDILKEALSAAIENPSQASLDGFEEALKASIYLPTQTILHLWAGIKEALTAAIENPSQASVDGLEEALKASIKNLPSQDIFEDEYVDEEIEDFRFVIQAAFKLYIPCIEVTTDKEAELKEKDPEESADNDSDSEDSDPESPTDKGAELKEKDPEESADNDSDSEDSDPESPTDKEAESEAVADSYCRDLGICIYVDKEEIPFHKASDSEDEGEWEPAVVNSDDEGEGEPVVINPDDDEIEVGILVEGEIKYIKDLLWLWFLSLLPKEEEEKEDVEIEDDEPYIDKIKRNERETGLSEAVETGTGELNGIKIAMGVMDFRFVGGSMGSVVGEKITRLIEHATKEFLPLIIVCASGGARMQEGSLSLMQMAKISSALSKYRDQKNKSNQKLFYISILTTPTTGGVTASFAMLGDIIIAEPDAYIAFAGKRVIEELFNIEVPEGSQEAEVLFENGFLDLIVPRNLLKSVLTELLQFHSFHFDPTLLSPKLIRRLFQN